MTLLLKKDVQPKLYKAPSIQHTSNQSTYRRNYLSEFLQEQKLFNNQLLNSFKEVSLDLKDSKVEHSSQLTTLAKNIEMEGLINQAIMDELTSQNQMNHRVIRGLEDNEKTYKDLIAQKKNQDDLYEEISNRLKMQEAFHETLLKQLDLQKMLSQKTSKQIDSLKTLFLEKITPIAEKIEPFIKKFSFRGEKNEKIEEAEKSTKHERLD